MRPDNGSLMEESDSRRNTFVDNRSERDREVPGNTKVTPTLAERNVVRQLAIPLLALFLFAGFVCLWKTGWHGVYFDTLRAIGALRTFDIKPWYFPFLDAHAVLSAAQCQREGINVYIENPCDVLGRVHVYSPIWLSLVPRFLSTADTARVGVVLDLAFILSLAAVLRPGSWREGVLFSAAVFSPTTIYAVERANNDVAIFIFVSVGSVLLGGKYLWRVFGYSCYLIAGMLKYYPLIVLVLVLRESAIRILYIELFSAIIVVAAIYYYNHEFIFALGNIPRLSYFMNTFSAQNLPYGLLNVFWGDGSVAHRLIGSIILVVLVLSSIAVAWKKACDLGHRDIDWSDLETRNLIIASLLLTGCFFAGQNEGYRGVFLLLALPGMVRLQSSVNDPSAKGWLSQMIRLCVVIMWSEFVRRGFDNLAGLGTPEFAQSPIKGAIWVSLWFGREIVWWWLISGLLAFAAAFVRSLPLADGIVSRLRRLRSSLLPGRLR